MLDFEFATAGRIVFGSGRLAMAAPAAAEMGARGLLLTGQSTQRADGLRAQLRRQGLGVTDHAIFPEPTIEMVAEATAAARRGRCQWVVAFGGGSVLDAGKAVAALLTNPGEPLDYLEVVGDGRPLGVQPAPMIAIPTTAGTGTEVTRNAVLRSPRHGVKVSMRHLWMLPRLAVVDPELTVSLPPAVTAATGLDALTQLLEAFVTPFGNPLTDAVCRQGLACAAHALRQACRDGGDLSARREMALASLCGGLALANAKLGAVHGLAAPLGGALAIPHGVVCGRLLAAVTAANIEVLDRNTPQAPTLARYREAAQIFTADPQAGARTAADWLRALVEDLPLADLSDYGPTPADLTALARQALQASSMKGNPVPLSEARLVRILQAVFRPPSRADNASAPPL